MEVTKGERLYIGIFGNTNSGKSSLMNMLIGQDYSIVSEVSGTTTDSVQKNMELPGVGPCVFIDTAGFDDDSVLGKQRVAKTYDALAKCDLVIAVLSYEEIICCKDASSVEKIFETEGFQKLILSGKPLVWVITKSSEKAELLQQELLQGKLMPQNEQLHQNNQLRQGEQLQRELDEIEGLEKIEVFKRNVPIFVDSITGKNKDNLIQAIKEKVPKEFSELYQSSLTEKYCNPGDNVLLVMPQDIQAPKGRLILPQVQTIRDLLDRKVCVHCCTQDTFLQTVEGLKKEPDLIITDSQLFSFVSKNKPSGSKLTSFSIMMAAHKGDIDLFMKGAEMIKQLKDSFSVLIAEACAHVPATEDIGTVKIPAMLRKIAPKVTIDFVRGTDFPSSTSELKKYDLIIHCGACMSNRAYMLGRQAMANNAEVPMTNYGLAIAVMTQAIQTVSCG